MADLEFDSELYAEFVTETTEDLDSLDTLFIKLEEYPDREILDHIFRVMHTAKGNISVFGFNHIKDFTHILENLLDRIRQDKVDISVDIVDILLNGKDLLSELIVRQKNNPTLDSLNDDEQSLLEVISRIKDKDDESDKSTLDHSLQEIIENWQRMIESQDLPEVEELLGEIQSLLSEKDSIKSSNSDLAEDFDYLFDEPPESNNTDNLPAETTRQATISNKNVPSTATIDKQEKATIRVEQEAIDGFLMEVGNLITLSERFKYLGLRMADNNVEHELRKDFQDIALSFHQLSMNLQHSVLNVRKVSVKALVQKIPRMVRSLAKNLNKQVDVKITGDDTTLDKSLLDVLDDPLIHFIRNSLDHGFEPPEIRKHSGKNLTGTLTVNASADDDHFFLTIKDDGKGIDPDLMRMLAVKKNLMNEDEASHLSEQEAQEIIFLPGFSTTEVVTDVSGRGVGMDVVMSNVKKVNGEVTLDSTKGIGSTFTIKLPLIGTTVVIQALQFKVGQNIFVVPLDDIQEVITPDKKFISTIQGKSKILKFRNRTTPITELKDLFNIKQAKNDSEDVVYIMIEHDQNSYALMVDELVRIQQVVIKDINQHFSCHRAICGTALMGDGNIAMVIDCKSLSLFLEEKKQIN